MAYDMKTLVTKTRGRAFVSKDCSGIDDGAFQYASATFIPCEVGDRATSKQTTSGPHLLTGVQSQACGREINETFCYKHSFSIDLSKRQEVEITMRLNRNGHEVLAHEFVGRTIVSKTLNKTLDLNETEELPGFRISFDTDTAILKHLGDIPKEYAEDIYDIFLIPSNVTRSDFINTIVSFKTTAKNSHDGEPNVNYYVTCEHPVSVEKDVPFTIRSKVTKGSTNVKYANVFARIHVSRGSDPSTNKPPTFVKLNDDGKDGDIKANDGTYSTILNANQMGAEDSNGISVMCNLMESPEGKWNDNNFWGRKKGVPTQDGDITPYCCGSNEEKWYIPRSKDVVKLLRSSMESGAYIQPNITDGDFGPPSRIADLKAEKFGEAREGLVKLSWTATGDDWNSGTVDAYNLVYSDKRKGLMSSNKITRDSSILRGGSLDPLPAGHRMEAIVKLENFHIPGTYLFAVNATDDAGKVSKPSNIARVDFHDGSPVVFDADPHLVHGHKKNEMSFEEKIRAIVKDERIVQGYMKHIEKNKKIVMDAENNVMEKRLKENLGLKDSAVKEIMKKIKNHRGMRDIYRK